MLAIETKRIQRKFGAALTLFALFTGACAGSEDDGPVGFGMGDSSVITGGGSPGAQGATPDAGAPATLGGGTPGTATPGGGTPGAGGGTPGAGGGTPGAGGGTPGAGGGTPGAGGGMDGGVAMGGDGGMVVIIPGDAASDTSVPPGDGGATGGGDTPDAQPPRMDLGKGDGKDVVLIGDSWMDNSLDLLGENTGGGIAAALKSLTKQPYRNYAVQGVMLLADDGFGKAIPTQWDDAVKADPNIKTVVMTAGGNDIIQGSAALQDSCKVGGDLCQTTLTKIGQTLGNLWKKMSAAGVQDIIYILYAKSANEGRLKDPALNNQQMQLLCSKVPPPARCFTVGTDDLVPAADLAFDGIHPQVQANRRIAKSISDLMVKEGMRR